MNNPNRAPDGPNARTRGPPAFNMEISIDGQPPGSNRFILPAGVVPPKQASDAIAAVLACMKGGRKYGEPLAEQHRNVITQLGEQWPAGFASTKKLEQVFTFVSRLGAQMAAE
jgi:hypothetical protein